MVAALEMCAFAEEGGTPLAVDQPGCDVGKGALGIGGGLAPFSVEEQRPAGAEPLQHVVGARAGRNELGLGGGLEVGAAEA